MKTWLSIDPQSDFSIYNLPFGIFSSKNHSRRPGMAIGDQVVDLQVLAEMGAFAEEKIPGEVFHQPVLNTLMALPRQQSRWIRMRVQQLLLETEEKESWQENASRWLIPMSDVQLHLPVTIGDYTDFYSSYQHAFNVGSMFRGPENALMPNWKHLPVAYHGRSSSIVVSGTDIVRPMGQRKPPSSEDPVFGVSARLDFELEMAFVVANPTAMGSRVSTAEAEEHIFGLLLFNDWSARDIQQWEYQPLGPFLGKNFGSSVSPWIVTLDALAPFRCEGPVQDPAVLPYLKVNSPGHFDLPISVAIAPREGKEKVISRSNYKYLYWSMAQQLAHHTVNGCPICTGDLMASGTISGESPDSFGSLLELTWGGKNTLDFEGITRTWIEDGDTVVMRGGAGEPGKRVGFGEVKGTILPAKPFC